jgi:hypothetical protein
MITLWMSPSWPLRGCHAVDIAMGGSSILSSLYALVELSKRKEEAMVLRNKPSQKPATAAAIQEESAATGQPLSKQEWYQDLMYW